MAPKLLAVFLVASLVACRSERITTTDVPIRAATDQAWSGGTLMLRSAAFVGEDTLPTVMVAGQTLGVRPLGPESVLVELPDTNGPLSLTVRLRSGATRTLDPVHAHGFVLAGFGPRLDGTPYPWPGGGAPTALGFQDGRLVLVDYRYDTAVPLTADTGQGPPCGAGPMPSPTEFGLVTTVSRSGGCGPMIATPVVPGAAPPDTGPPPATYWAEMQLGRGHWLVNYKYTCSLLVRAPSGGFTTVVDRIPSCDEMSGFTVSPRGDRVVPFQNTAPGGPPVFEPAGPSVVYTIPALTVIGGVAFSEGGDTMFAAGLDQAYKAVFVSLDAASGRVLDSTALSPQGLSNYYAASAVAIDPNRPWVYVADERDRWPYVEVFDRSSLARIATLRVPAGAINLPAYDTRLWNDNYVIVMSPVERRLYLTINSPSHFPAGASAATYVLRFDLLP